MRRMFDLPIEDRNYLDCKKYDWETIIENNQFWLIILNFPIPNGYNISTIALAIHISQGYPDAQLDMVYCYPSLDLQNGKSISALASHTVDSKVWQRWSRHRTAENPWRQGIDNIATHLSLAEEWLLKETQK